MAARLEPRRLREIVEKAQDLDRFDPAAIRAHPSRHPRRPGCARLRDLLDLLEPDTDGARSHLECLFLRLVRSARLPEPEVNRRVGSSTRDFAWPSQRIAVEVDGHAYHASRSAKRRDHRRDRGLTALGWRPLRFTYEEIAFEPRRVAAELVDLLGRPTGPPAARGR